MQSQLNVHITDPAPNLAECRAVGFHVQQCGVCHGFVCEPDANGKKDGRGKPHAHKRGKGTVSGCSPDMEMMYQVRKNRTEITVGIPSPPFRIMAPRGAPIKKKIRQAIERVNFLCISIWYFRSRVTFALELVLELEM